MLGRIRSFVGLKVVANVLYKSLYIFLSIAQKPASLGITRDAGKESKIWILIKKCKPAAIVICLTLENSTKRNAQCHSVIAECRRHYETKCSEESLEMLRFAMANATLRERYTQHDKTGSFILWLTLIFKNADGETRTRKGYAHTHLKRARIPIPPHPRGLNTD